MGILSGIRVVEITHWVAGPTVGAVLGDMGAEVIVIEQVGEVAGTRTITTLGQSDFTAGGESVLSASVMRNKASICLDLKSAEGQAIFHDLIRTAEVFHTNLRSPALQDRGADYSTLRDINESLVYSQLSAFGEHGPLANAAGYDFLMQGFSGIMKAGGHHGDPTPSPPIQIFVDHTTGLLSAYSIVAALLHRERTGEGQKLHTSLLSACLNMFTAHGLSALQGLTLAKHDRNAPGNPLRNFYECADGRWIVMAHNPASRYWDTFMRVFDLEHLNLSPDMDERTLVDHIADAIAKRPLDEWLELADAAGLVCGPVNTSDDVFGHPQVAAAGLIAALPRKNGEEFKMPSFPTAFDRTPVGPQRAASATGEDTRDILAMLGLGEARIEELHRKGIVG